MKIAVFPGSFDPVTLGHLSVIEAVAPLFDKLYVAIGVNADKPGCFPVEQRKQWLQQVLSSFENIEIIDAFKYVKIDSFFSFIMHVIFEYQMFIIKLKIENLGIFG